MMNHATPDALPERAPEPASGGMPDATPDATAMNAAMRLLCLLIAGLPAAFAELRGQIDPVRTGDSTGSWVRFTGTAALSGDFHALRATPGDVASARRPAALGRLMLNAALGLGEAVEIPITLIITVPETSTLSAVPANPSFAQSLLNPANSAGLVGISPKMWDWAEFHLGTHTPRYSELTAGDQQVFGLGFDFRPGRFRIAASAGSVQRAVEGIVAGLDGRIVFSEALTLRAEAAASAYTRDIGSALVERPVPAAVNTVFAGRVSSRYDMAATAEVLYRLPEWDVRATVRYLGPGFVPLGYPFVSSDRLEATLAPKVRLFANRLTAHGSVGFRSDNFSGIKQATATSVLGSLMLFAMPTDELSIAASYSNYGIRSDASNDTLKIAVVSQSMSLAPAYTIAAEGAMHTVGVQASLDDFADHNVVTGATVDNQTRSVGVTYAAAFTETPLALDATATYLQNTLAGRELDILGAGAGAAVRLADGAFIPSVGVGYTRSTFGGNTADNNVTVRLGLRWRASERLALSLNASTAGYVFGSARPGAEYREHLLRVAATTTW